MEWRDDYAMGHAVLDTQHQQLFRLANELEMALQAGASGEEVVPLLSQVKTYAVRHFTIEERQMTAMDYPGLKAQQLAHRAFRGRFQELYDAVEKHGITPELAELTRSEVVRWVEKHVLGIDQKFAAFYREAVADGRAR